MYYLYIRSGKGTAFGPMGGELAMFDVGWSKAWKKDIFRQAGKNNFPGNSVIDHPTSNIEKKSRSGIRNGSTLAY
ncbi:MAG: hypothetical protein DI535_19760 [Citrobacter freundii]|nr:MAG: hypothetical protein DI535_19760 [Citrobacter freundii]